MKLGIFSKTFIRPILEETIAAIAAHNLQSIQFNWETAGLEEMPAEVPTAHCQRIRQSLEQHGVELVEATANRQPEQTESGDSCHPQPDGV